MSCSSSHFRCWCRSTCSHFLRLQAHSNRRRPSTAQPTPAGIDGRADSGLCYGSCIRMPNRRLCRRKCGGKMGAQRAPNPLVEAVIECYSDRPAAIMMLRQSFDNPDNHNQATLTTVYQLADALGDRDLALSALRNWCSTRTGPVPLDGAAFGSALGSAVQAAGARNRSWRIISAPRGLGRFLQTGRRDRLRVQLS